MTGDGYTYEELRQKAEEIRQKLLSVENVQKVSLLGSLPFTLMAEIAKGLIRLKLNELGLGC